MEKIRKREGEGSKRWQLKHGEHDTRPKSQEVITWTEGGKGKEWL